jgi:hypothetical protein
MMRLAALIPASASRLAWTRVKIIAIYAATDAIITVFVQIPGNEAAVECVD